jgi:hypothetical protein
MNNAEETRGTSKRSGPKLFAIVVGIAVLSFLGGFVPMWLSVRNTRDELRETNQRLNLSQIETSMGAAAIDARRGDYENARREASQFFISPQEEVDRGAQSALNPYSKRSQLPSSPNVMRSLLYWPEAIRPLPIGFHIFMSATAQQFRVKRGSQVLALVSRRTDDK